MDELLGRRVPYSATAEQAVIGSMLIDSRCIPEVLEALAEKPAVAAKTIVVVTGDHETGGMSMGFAGTGGRFKVEFLANQKCSAERLSTIVKKMLKESPDRPFEDVKPLLVEKFGFVFDGDAKDPMLITPAELANIKKAFEADRMKVKKRMADTTAHDVGRVYVFADAVKRTMAAHAGVGWSSGSHTALPTLTTAKGAGADILVGMSENSDIGMRLKKLFTQ